MEDLKQIQEFFSKPLEEMMSLDDQAKAYYLAKVKSGEIDTLPEDPKAAFLAQMTKDQIDHDKETLRRERGLEEEKKLTYNDFVRMVRDDMMAGSSPDDYISDEQVKKRAKSYYNEYLKGTSVDDLFEAESEFSPIGYAKKVHKKIMTLAAAAKEADMSQSQLAKLIQDKFNKNFKMTYEADVPVSEDIPDIIAVDVPLFIRLLEFAREDAGDDMDLHEVAERAIEAVKARGVLSMDDYDTLVPPKDLDEGKLVVTKDKIDRLARQVAAQISKQKNTRDAQEFLKKAIEDAYAKVFASDEYEIQEEEGYSKFLEDDPEFPGGKTKGLTPDVMNKILMKIVQDVDEAKRPGLWDNIRAQRERGEKPARKGSKEYKAAVAAGKRINKEK